MPTDRNPSHTLTDKEVDDIVDRMLLGKYEKHRPAQPIEAIRAGLMSLNICRDYVRARWGHRWLSGTPRTKDGPLSAAGITMRSNKLWERAQDAIHEAKKVGSDELVWKIWDGRTYDTVCYATGSAATARQWAWTLFGWTLSHDPTIDRLRVELIGGGGIIAASSMNMGLVGRLSKEVEELRKEAQRKLDEADRRAACIDSVMGAAAHLAGGAGATG